MLIAAAAAPGAPPMYGQVSDISVMQSCRHFLLSVQDQISLSVSGNLVNILRRQEHKQ